MLTDDDFTHGGATYQITAIVFQRGSPTSPWNLSFTFDKAVPQDLLTSTLNVGTKQLSLTGSTTSDNTTFIWLSGIESTFAVTVGNTLSMSLTVMDTTAPTLSGATVNGSTLTLTFSEALSTAAAPAASRFTVAGTESPTTVSGVAFKSGDAKSVELTLSPAVTHGDTGITVTYAQGSDINPLKDASENKVADFSGERVTNSTPDPTPLPPVITSAEGVQHSENPNDDFPIIPLIPLGEVGSFVYGERTIDISVTRNECPSPDNLAVIIPRSILDRVNEITFKLSEVPPQPPQGFRLEGFAAGVELGVTLGVGETVRMCLPPTEVQGESYIYRHEGSGEWKRLESRLESVNRQDLFCEEILLLCAKTDSFSLFGVFVPVIESAEGVLHSEDPEDGFSLTPLGEGGNIVYGERTIDISVTGDVDPSSSNPTVIVSRSVLDHVNEITFDLSDVSPEDPPSGFRHEGFAAEVNLGVTLGEEETVGVCFPSAGGEDVYRYNDESEEWGLLDSWLDEINGEDVVCAETGAVSLMGVFVEETGGCVIASANGEGMVRWQGALFNLLLAIFVLLLIPGMSRLK